MAAPFLSLIIPAYNEERRLPGTLQKVFTFLNSQSYPGEVIVVENGSQDRTFEVASAFTGEHPNLHVLREDLSGKGRAVRRGMLEARGDYRFICDADLSMPITELPRFLPPNLANPDIVIASREAPGAVRYNEPAYRHFTGRIFNTLIRLLVLPDLQDTQCGFKCFRADVVETIFRRQTLTGWSFDVEVLHIARLHGYNVIELPIPWYFNAGSKISVLRDSWRMFNDLLTIRRNARMGLYN